MMLSHPGELASLAVAIFWTITAISFSNAVNRIGSLTVNLLRLVLAFLFIGILTYFLYGHFLPAGATKFQWVWLSVSGLIGFVLGDLFLFKSYSVISVRISMLVMSLAPPVAAVTEWIFLGEKMAIQSLIGMIVTLFGISIVILSREKEKGGDTIKNKTNKKKIKLLYPIFGILLAFGGAVGQGVGIVLSRYGMQGYNAFSATQIRIITGIAGFLVLFLLMGRFKSLVPAVKDRKAMISLFSGSFFGPFLGVSFSLVAIQHTSAGIASTIMSIVPVLIIPASVILYKEKIRLKEIFGAIVTVAGVTIFFI